MESYYQWLAEGSGEQWSIYNLRDAQKQSLIAFGCSALLAGICWKGLPIPLWLYDPKKEVMKKGEWVTMRYWLPVLWPFKMLTVLFHEVSHAIVGTLSGGRVQYISVDATEGGLTAFKKDPKHPIWTLAAGYFGSCFIGCGFIFCGFDTLTSKYAALAMEVMTAVSLLICMRIHAKSWIRHEKVRINHSFHRVGRSCCCSVGPSPYERHVEDIEIQRKDEWDKRQFEKLRMRAKAQNPVVANPEGTEENSKAPFTGEELVLKEEEKEDDFGTTVKDRMLSSDIIILIDILVLVAVFLAWYFNDSLYLRFIMIGMGTMSALYACADIYIDGVLHGEDGDSDAAQMAIRYNEQLRVKNEKLLKEKGVVAKTGRERSTKHYAQQWLLVSTNLLIATVVLALFTFRGTIAEQAQESANFLPTTNHYSGSDILSGAQDAISSAKNAVQGGRR